MCPTLLCYSIQYQTILIIKEEHSATPQWVNATEISIRNWPKFQLETMVFQNWKHWYANRKFNFPTEIH